MRLANGVMAIAALLCPAPAFAQDSPAAASPTDERRLTPEQVEAVLAEVEARRSAAESRQVPPPPAEGTADDTEPALAPPIHGELGFSVGTGGYREIFGTGIYPLGHDGIAVFSFDFVDWGNRPFRY
ncbi:MAG TPA: hypothetical protein VFR36_09955 [Sphingomicrobium sp.]|nr:hypothetical protein [Sphingomicrobium sp.]